MYCFSDDKNGIKEKRRKIGSSLSLAESGNALLRGFHLNKTGRRKWKLTYADVRERILKDRASKRCIPCLCPENSKGAHVACANW